MKKRYEILVWNTKDKAWYSQTFDTRKSANDRKIALKNSGYKVKGPK